MKSIAFSVPKTIWERLAPHWEIAKANGVSMSQFARAIFLVGLAALEDEREGGAHGKSA